MGRNERKAAVLGLLLRKESVVTRDLVERWSLTHSGAQASLENYRRHSLLSRKREPGPGPPVYRYILTNTGRQKAAWFAGQALIQARKKPRGPGGNTKTSHRRVLKPKTHPGRVVIRPLIHQPALMQIEGIPEGLEKDGDPGPKLIKPKIHQRRAIRPKIYLSRGSNV